MAEEKPIIEDQKRDNALYFIEEGEPGFNPEHNKYVIEKTIKKTEQFRKLKQRMFKDQIGERADAVATYLTSRVAEGVSPIEKYFGKKMLAHLRGEKILQVLKEKYSLGGKKRTLYLPGN